MSGIQTNLDVDIYGALAERWSGETSKGRKQGREGRGSKWDGPLCCKLHSGSLECANVTRNFLRRGGCMEKLSDWRGFVSLKRSVRLGLSVSSALWISPVWWILIMKALTSVDQKWLRCSFSQLWLDFWQDLKAPGSKCSSSNGKDREGDVI